jgi:hypothetical protein
MTEALRIKCPLCKDWFDRSSYDEEPRIDVCKCENITIEVKALEDEKPLFTVTYKEAEPGYKIPKIK